MKKYDCKAGNSSDPETGSAGQSMVLLRPSLWVQSLYGSFTWKLDLNILVGPFQFRIFGGL